jgi:hypothetical protein
MFVLQKMGEGNFGGYLSSENQEGEISGGVNVGGQMS